MASHLRIKAKCLRPTLLCRPHLVLFSLLLTQLHPNQSPCISSSRSLLTYYLSLSKAFPDHKIINGSLQTLTPYFLSPFPNFIFLHSIDCQLTYYISFIFFVSLSPLKNKPSWGQRFQSIFLAPRTQIRCSRSIHRIKKWGPKRQGVLRNVTK